MALLTHNTTTAKYAGLEGLAVELERGLWMLPDGPPTRALVQEMLAYNPAGHAGDRLVALWLAREAAEATVKREPLPMPFIRGSAPLPVLPTSSGGAIVAAAGDFPFDAWADISPWVRF